MTELLAPAGTREALDRAIAAGANAVYLGYSAFSARATAGNFDEPSLREAVRFAHLHHVRVHVTVNTLIKDSELDEVISVLRLLNSIPVDAVLVQDLGVLSLARECFPALNIHASTQMAIHNATGVRWCREQGMTRAVLARECPLSEIALCAKEGIEVEVFGHGAQCVSVSGECLMSSMLGGRSGNRGRCAQPCRMAYTYRGQTAAWLSPRDVCTRADLPLLQKAGVASLKLEGRLKRPEYVGTVTEIYRQALDNFHAPTAEETDTLLQSFQRGGFMHGYAMGCEDAGVIYPDRVSHGGLSVGTVESVSGGMAKIRLTRNLNDGDGLQLRGRAGDREMTYAGHDTPVGSLAVLRLRPGSTAEKGDEVSRLTDAAQLEHVRSMPMPLIPCDMMLTAVPGVPLMLTAMDDSGAAVTVQGDTVSPAAKRALTEEDARRCLEKTGGTPFTLHSFHLEGEGGFVAVSALNALRREALEQLEGARADAFGQLAGMEKPLPEIVLPSGDVPETIIFRTEEQLNALNSSSARLVWYPEDYRADALEAMLPRLPDGCWFRLPTVCCQNTLEQLHRFVTMHTDKIGGVMLGSIGQLGLNWPVPFGTSADVPVMNRRAAAFLFRQGCAFVTASPELNSEETRRLVSGDHPILVPAWGRTRLMLLHHCPARTYLGLSHDHAECAMCDIHSPDALEGTCLRDRMGCDFPLLRERLPEGCHVRLLNHLPTDLRSETAGMVQLIELTNESSAETMRIAASLPSNVKTTSGHWRRGVE